METVHIGKKIKEKVEEMNLSKKEFAEMISRSGTSVHELFRKEYIRTDELERISQILDFNFFSYYAQSGLTPEGSPKEALQLTNNDEVGVIINLDGKYSEQILELVAKQLADKIEGKMKG
jgi:transposase